MTDQAAAVGRLVDALREMTDRACFACGPDNPIGLHLDDFGHENGWVTARFAPRHEYQGTIGSLHGGIAATALDEIMVWAGILQEAVLSVTGKLELRYRRPLANTGSYRLRGRVDTRRGRRLTMEGAILAEDEPAVTATGLYLVSRDLGELIE